MTFPFTVRSWLTTRLFAAVTVPFSVTFDVAPDEEPTTTSVVPPVEPVPMLTVFVPVVVAPVPIFTAPVVLVLPPPMVKLPVVWLPPSVM